MPYLNEQMPSPDIEELDIIAGHKIPTKKKLLEMRKKFAADKEILEALQDTEASEEVNS